MLQSVYKTFVFFLLKKIIYVKNQILLLRIILNCQIKFSFFERFLYLINNKNLDELT